MSIIKNEFELSVWEDRIGADDLFEERKLVVIASDKMESSISAFDIKLTSNINGSNNLSFSIYGKYKTESGLEDNPFIPYLVNERKIKLKYKGKWYDFIIKNKDEESGNYRFNFSAIDLHINELSKNGFNLEFDQKLNNNQGSAIELAEKVLENTDWQVVDNTLKPVGSKIYDDEGNEIRSNLITQEIKENLISYTVYNAPLRAKEIIYDEYLGTSISSVDTIFPIGTSIYVFYTCATQEGETVQFICNIDQKYTKDSERIITNGKYYLISSPTYEQIENNFANRIKSNGSVLNPGKVSDEYKGERYVISYKTKFDPLTQKYVTIYKDEQDKEVYVYQETQYITPSIIDNYVSNSKDYKNSSGWTGYNVTSVRDIPKINDVTTPDIIKEYARRETSETTIYTPLLKNYIINTDSVIVNSGINDNKVKIETFAEGEKYVLYFDVSAFNSDEDAMAFEYTPCTASSIPFESVKIVSYHSNSNGQYIEDEVIGEFDLATLARDGQYFYCLADCLLNLSKEEVKVRRFGITFKFNNTGYVWFKDIQLFKYLTNENGIILPSTDIQYETIIAKSYWGYKPSDNTEATEVEDIKYCLNGSQILPSDFVAQKNNNSVKILDISGKESNYFNFLQSICEKFQCWIKFDVCHEDNGKIIKNKKYVSFHKNVGEENYAGFRYGVNLKSIQRTLESKSIVSKLIVKPNNNQYAKNGFCTIARAQSNPTKQTEIYNFDNYVNAGLLSYEEVQNDLWGENGYYTLLSAAAKSYDEASQKYENIQSILYQITSDLEVASAAASGASDAINSLEYKIEKQYGCSFADFGKGMAAETPVDKNHAQAIALFNNYKELIYEGEKLFGGGPTLQKSLYADLKEMNTHIINYETNHEKELVLTEELNGYKEQQETYKNEMIAYTNAIRAIELNLYTKYSRFIQEGTWIDEGYLDDEKYYLDALSVSYDSSMPKVSYSINVYDLGLLDDLNGFHFNIGDRTYIEDTEYFGYVIMDGIKTPYKEKIVITEYDQYPGQEYKNTIKVQNFKTQFQDLFHRITATVQSVNFASGAYNRAVEAVKPDGTISLDFLQNSFNQNAIDLRNAKSQTVVWNEKGITVSSEEEPNKIVRLINGGLYMTQDGGETWELGISAEGINTNKLTAGAIDAGIIQIVDGEHPSFRWDSNGINAYDKNGEQYYNYNRFVRLNRFGLFGFDGDASTFSPETVDDIKDNTDVKFALTWDGFLFRHSSDDGSIVIGEYDKTVEGEVINTYGIVINKDGEPVVEINEYGDAYFKGTISSSAGNIGPFVLNDDGFSYLYSDPSLKINGGVLINKDNGVYVFRDYNGEFTKAQLTPSGELIAKEAYISGAITAGRGQIANWLIGQDVLYTYTDVENTGNLIRHFTTMRSRSDSEYAFTVENWEYEPNGNSSFIDMPFYVKHDGKLFAKNAEIEGKITTSLGEIGGWELSGTTLNSNNEVNGSPYQLFLRSAPTDEDKGKYAFQVYDVNNKKNVFAVGFDGSLTATKVSLSGNIMATSGKIGNWVINSGGISNGTTSLNSNGSVTLKSGSIGGWTITDTAITSSSGSAGIKMSSTNNSIIIGNGSEQVYLRAGDIRLPAQGTYVYYNNTRYSLIRFIKAVANGEIG